jgi:hypothetical protein
MNFSKLPNEILFIIFGYLPNEILNNLNLISPIQNSFTLFTKLYHTMKFIECKSLIRNNDDSVRINYLNQILKSIINFKNIEFCKFIILNSFTIDLNQSDVNLLFKIYKDDKLITQLLFDKFNLVEKPLNLNFLLINRGCGALYYST